MNKSFRNLLLPALLAMGIHLPASPSMAFEMADGNPYDTSAAPEAPSSSLSPKATGALMMLGGAVMVPVGMSVAADNMFEKCDEDATFSIAICGDHEPNKGAFAAGLGSMMGGTLLFLTGLITLATSP